MVSDAINDFGVDDNFSKHDQIRNELPNSFLFVNNFKSSLLFKLYLSATEFDRQCILVELLVQTVTQLVRRVEREAHNPIRLVFQRKVEFLGM